MMEGSAAPVAESVGSKAKDGFAVVPPAEAKRPADRNSDLAGFMLALDEYAPTLPEEVTQYYLSRGGMNVADPRINKLVSLAADKFMADIIFDAKQFSFQRSQRKDLKRKAATMSETFEFEDLVRSLKTRAITIRRHHGSLPDEKEQK